jgi:broad specificity phosphatase PhoE
MQTIYIVRHGQANSLGAYYDELTDFGRNQCTKLGEYFKKNNIQIDYSASGEMARQQETLSLVLKHSNQSLVESKVHKSLNEFGREISIHYLSSLMNEFPKAKSIKEKWEFLKSQKSERSKMYFQKILKELFAVWTQNQSPDDPLSFYNFKKNRLDVWKEIPKNAKSILLVTSNTPISIYLSESLKIPDSDLFHISRRIENTSLSIFQVNATKKKFQTINSLVHLESQERSLF